MARSFSLDVRLANKSAVVLILLAKVRGEIRTAHRDHVLSLGRKLRSDLRHTQRRGEPPDQLGEHFVRHLCRRHQNGPKVCFDIGITELKDGGYVRHLLDPLTRHDRERPQLAYLHMLGCHRVRKKGRGQCPPNSELSVGAAPPYGTKVISTLAARLSISNPI